MAYNMNVSLLLQLLLMMMIVQLCCTTVQRHKQLHIEEDSKQHYSAFIVERNETEEGDKNKSIHSQKDIHTLDLKKVPDSFMYKFCIGLIFAITPVRKNTAK